MQLQTNIVLENKVYRVTIRPLEFSAAEQDLLSRFGEPLIEVGGQFDGTYSRPNRTAVALAFSGGGGSGASASVASVNIDGGIASVEIDDGGADYSTAPSVVITGDGQSAEITATVTDGAVTGLEIDEAGFGYTLSPVTVDFALPAKSLRLRSESPILGVFDLRDDVNSDIKAKTFADTIVARIQEAMTKLQAQKAAFVSSTTTTTT